VITLEPLDVDAHAERLHGWVTHPRSSFWMMQDATPEEVAADYRNIAADPHHDAWLGTVDGEPAFLAETYDPVLAPAVGLAGLAELRPGDLGMHLLVGPGTRVRHGFTRRVFAAVMEHCFSDPAVHRVVVEPDVRNDRVAVLNREAGFVVERVVDLPGKQAALSFCTRSDWEAHR
jgi:RimJ/RimL family protein N-acetyltransferase